MSTKQFFDNPAFREYVRSLFELHVLIRRGADETPAGEVLRDRMDGPGGRLSEEEREAVAEISADFYSLGEAPQRSPVARSAAVQEDLRAANEAGRRGDFLAALRLLRRQEEVLESAELAYLRGTVWRELGEYRIATEFFQRAAECNPTLASYATQPPNSIPA
jgi:hypothetical protein